jgi:hypothetical protein
MNIKRNVYIYLHKSKGDPLGKETVTAPSSLFEIAWEIQNKAQYAGVLTRH